VSGRWLNRDPLQEDGGLNQYGFVENNPVMYIDQLGLVRWGTVLQGSLQVVSGSFMVWTGATSLLGSGGLSAPIAVALSVWGSASILNGVSTLRSEFSDKGPSEPLQVRVVQKTYETITGHVMSPNGLNITRFAYYSIDIAMSCYSIHTSWTTMTKTGIISTRLKTVPLEIPLSSGAPVGVLVQHTTSHLVFYGHTTGAATQSISVMLDCYGTWNSVFGIGEDLFGNMSEPE
jgi:hypothetical protein